MPRNDASAAFLSSIAQPWAQPFYLLQLNFVMPGNIPYRANNTGTDITVTSDAIAPYLGKGVQIDLGAYNEASASVSVKVPDPDQAILGVIEAQDLGQVAIIRKGFFDTRTFPNVIANYSDTIQAFYGMIAGAPSVGPIIEFRLTPQYASRRLPHIICGPPTNNFNAQPGTQLQHFFGNLDITE